MRAPPPLKVSLNRSELWRMSLCALALAVVASTVAWAWSNRDQRSTAVLGTAALATLAVVVLLLRFARVRTAELQWDGSCWMLSDAESPQALRGDVRVAIDLGIWMLLCFVPEDSPAAGRVRWLPVQRGGIENQWHALRCAVFAPARLPDSA